MLPCELWKLPQCPDQLLRPLLICNAGVSDTTPFNYWVFSAVFLTPNGFYKLCAPEIALWLCVW